MTDDERRRKTRDVGLEMMRSGFFFSVACIFAWVAWQILVSGGVVCP